MRFVVDTNILFSFFWKTSITRKLLVTSNFELISPEIALRELKKYEKEIRKKTGITEKEFNCELKNLKSVVKFIDKKEYSKFISEAEKTSPDKADVEFLALCMKFSCFLWSNDNLLKNQDKVRVISTEDLIEILF